jgi:hypothetical protein
MRKEVIYFVILVFTIVILNSGFSAYKDSIGQDFYKNFNHTTEFRVITKEETQILNNNPLFTKNTFLAFKQALAVKESAANYRMVNAFGYLGKYQFGKSTLKIIGITNVQLFLNNPALQELAFEALLAKNKHLLRYDIKRFCGKKVNGVYITESGILAAAHLAGAQSVKNYLRSNGNQTFYDGFGTSLSSYLRKFAGYDTTVILANKNAKVY